jgi:internalin A
VLRLNNNELTSLPDSLARLKHLRELDLRDNQLTTLPDSFSYSGTPFPSLTQLFLHGNAKLGIPDEILGRRTSRKIRINELARELDVKAHEILDLLPELGVAEKKTHSSSVDWQTAVALRRRYSELSPGWEIGQHLVGTDYDVGPADPRAILTYYFANRAGGSRPLREAKLILVGRGGVGKTSLIKKLSTGQFVEGEPPTDGIKIIDWRIQTVLDQAQANITLHTWDFGGQELMHSTHQFFLTKRSLYLLVLSRRQDGNDEEADYWFRLIRAFGGEDSPVIVVLNDQRRQPFDVNRRDWTEAEKYGDNIKDFVETACEDNASIERLRVAISRALAGMTSLQDSFPAKWFSIKDRLATMPEDFLTFDIFREICSSSGEVDRDQQEMLSGYLHDLGIALNYRDDPRLRFGHILKPEWVTTGIYALIHAFIKSGGEFTPEQAERVLAGKGYTPEAAAFLINLMDRFELALTLSESPGRQRFLIPQLLPDQQPEIASTFTSADCLNFGYQYPILPNGVLPRFIVRTSHLSREMRWKSGVILTHPSGCRALVKADKPTRQVRIHIAGPADSRRDLLAIIRHNFDVIHSDYEFLPEELVYPKEAPEKAVVLGEVKMLQSEGETELQIVVDRKVLRPSVSELSASAGEKLKPLKAFLSYAHADEDYINTLRKALRPLERNGLIQPWYDRALRSGELWDARIAGELESADVIVCQLSIDYLGSDYCVKELDIALSQQRHGKAILAPYVLFECGWRKTPLSDYQLLHGARAMPKDVVDRSAFWQSIADGIEAAIEGRSARVDSRQVG